MTHLEIPLNIVSLKPDNRNQGQKATVRRVLLGRDSVQVEEIPVHVPLLSLNPNCTDRYQARPHGLEEELLAAVDGSRIDQLQTVFNSDAWNLQNQPLEDEWISALLIRQSTGPTTFTCPFIGICQQIDSHKPSAMTHIAKHLRYKGTGQQVLRVAVRLSGSRGRHSVDLAQDHIQTVSLFEPITTCSIFGKRSSQAERVDPNARLGG
ncbi:11772_t:CDS:2, partial [Acaulospora colombiana]